MLFDFIKEQGILENDELQTTFRNAWVNGKTFLERGNNEDFWWCRCKLPLGPSDELARLAQRIKDYATDAKRIAEEADRIAEEAERDELIKSENSRAVCDPKAIAN